MTLNTKKMWHALSSSFREYTDEEQAVPSCHFQGRSETLAKSVAFGVSSLLLSLVDIWENSEFKLICFVKASVEYEHRDESVKSVQ